MQVIPLPEVNTNQKATALIILSIFQAEMLHLLRMHSLCWNDGCALCSDLVEFTLCLSHRYLPLIFSLFQSWSPLLLSNLNVRSEHFKTETTHFCGAHWKQLCGLEEYSFPWFVENTKGISNKKIISIVSKLLPKSGRHLPDKRVIKHRLSLCYQGNLLMGTLRSSWSLPKASLDCQLLSAAAGPSHLYCVCPAERLEHQVQEYL